MQFSSKFYSFFFFQKVYFVNKFLKLNLIHFLTLNHQVLFTFATIFNLIDSRFYSRRQTLRGSDGEMALSIPAPGPASPGWNPPKMDRCQRSYCIDVNDLIAYPGAPWESCCIQVGNFKVDPTSPIHHSDEWGQLRAALQDQIKILELRDKIAGNLWYT